MNRPDPRTSRQRTVRTLIALSLIACCSACSKDPAAPGEDPPPPPPPPPPETAAVDAYVATLGSWTEFAPPLAASNEPLPEESTVTEQVVEEEDAAGVLRPVNYVCTSTPYSLDTTPEELVMYEPNSSVTWVGNLIQGKSYRDGTGSFQELSIRQRAPLKISIDLLTGDNSATVTDPSLSSVQSAIGELIERAHERGHRSGSSITYKEDVAHSVEQAALSLGLSARFLGARAKTELNIERSANERTLVAHFVQKMFTISMELPQSPEAIFSDEFTDAVLQQQVTAGNIGRNNLPVYIASVTYGRVLTYTLTSTDSEERMRAAIAASYNGVGGGVAGYTEAELRETLSQQNISVTAIGGEGQNVLDLISRGNLKAYVTTDAALTSARPLSYQLNFLGDNSIAKVGESTEYELRTCEQKVVSPGRFEFLSLQQGTAPVPTPYQVHQGDVNGDGRDDLIFSHLVSGTNRFAVGFGRADGSFDMQPAHTHPETPSGSWNSQYELLVEDFTSDGKADLLWSRVNGTNTFYLAVAGEGGAWDFRAAVTHPLPSWAVEGWETLSGDVDDDGDADLIWSYLGDTNRTAIGLSNGDGSWNFAGLIVHAAQGWSPYTTYVADINGDRRDDLIWNTTSATNTNRTYVGLSKGDGTLELRAYQDRGAGWGGYETHVGDVNRDGNADLIWLATDHDEIPIHRGFGQASGSFTFPRAQFVPRPENAGPLTTLIGDFNDDGSNDILWNDLSGNANHLWVGLGNEGGTFDFTADSQEHPATEGSSVDWTAYKDSARVLDVNGDSIDDVVWVAREGIFRIYVALGRALAE